MIWPKFALLVIAGSIGAWMGPLVTLWLRRKGGSSRQEGTPWEQGR
jgi:hypothetical protein